MIDGIWWLVILLSVVVGLWLLAKSRGERKSNNASGSNDDLKQPKLPSNDALQKTLVLLNKHFPQYRVTRKANHLLIIKQTRKIAMITIDKKVATGQRLLGEVPILNYHRAPSRELLAANLEDAE